MYSIEGLRQGILNSKQNIRDLERAIKKEEATQAEYRGMIKSIKEAEKSKEEAEANVYIEVCQ